MNAQLLSNPLYLKPCLWQRIFGSIKKKKRQVQHAQTNMNLLRCWSNRSWHVNKLEWEIQRLMKNRPANWRLEALQKLCQQNSKTQLLNS